MNVAICFLWIHVHQGVAYERLFDAHYAFFGKARYAMRGEHTRRPFDIPALPLEEAELIAVRREGRYRLHRLQPEPLRDVVQWSAEFAIFFGQRLDALDEYLDRKHPKRPRNCLRASTVRAQYVDISK